MTIKVERHTYERVNAKAGLNRVRTPRLRRGRYRVNTRAVDSAGNSARLTGRVKLRGRAR